MTNPFFSLFFLLISVFQFNSLSGQTTTSWLKEATNLRPFIETVDGRLTFKRDTESIKQYAPILMSVFDLEEKDAEEFFALLTDKLDGNLFFGDANNAKIFINENQASTSINLSSFSTENAPMENSGGNNDSGPSSSNFITNAIDGFSKWLVARTKQELALTFFSDFKKALDSQQDLNLLFTETVSLLDLIDSEIYQYEAYLKSLREAFIYDLKMLPQNLPDWAEQTTLIDNPNTRFIVKESLELPPMVFKGAKPNEIISHLAKIDDEPDDKDIQTVLSVFKAVNFISESLLNPNIEADRGMWISPDVWKNDIDLPTIYMYLGILWYKANDIQFGEFNFNNAVLSPIASDATSEKLNKFKDLVGNFLDEGNKAFELLKEIKELEKDSVEIRYSVFRQYVRTLIDFLETGDEFRMEFLSPGSAPIPNPAFNKLTYLLDHTNNLIYHVRQQNYLQAASELSLMTESFFSDSTQFESFKKDYFKYVTFMASMADAESASEIETVFEAYALPSGSSKMKKESYFSVALNAYVGMTGAVEYLEKSGSKGIFAMSAPVGVNVNWGHGQKGSFSLFAPILDVGAVTAFRFNDNTSTLPKLSFQNFFAPGLYLVYGFGNDLPFALAAGGQIGPNTRKIEFDDMGNAVENRVDSGWRFGVTLTVDIPVFHFYTQAEKKK